MSLRLGSSIAERAVRAIFWRSRSAVTAWRRRRQEAAWRAADSAAWIAEAQRRRWIFVVGCTRSGKSTLVNLLGSHPDVTVIPRADLKTAALVHPRDHGIERVWTEKLELFRLTETSDRRHGGRLVFDWMSYARRPGSVIVIDSNLPAVQMRWLQEIFEDSHFIGIVRNGYAVAAAMREKSGHAIDRCARHWSAVNATMFADAPAIRSFLDIRYEDFVAEPVGVARSIAERTGLALAGLRPALDGGWRLGAGGRTGTPLRNDNAALVQGLSRGDIAAIEAHAGDMLTRLNYLPLGPWPERTHAHDGR